MKKYIFLLLIILSGLSLHAQNQTILLDKSKNEFSVYQATDKGFTIKSSLGELNWEKLSIDKLKTDFIEFRANGYSKPYGKGEPALPILTKMIEVPENADVEFRIVSYNEQIIDLKKEGILHKIIPAQPSIRKTPQKELFYFSKELYSLEFFTENKIVTVNEIGYFRNIKLAEIQIQPFQYNPQEDLLKIWNDLEIEITFKYHNATTKYTQAHENKDFRALAQNFTINALPYGKNLITQMPATYVIVADRKFETTLQDFILWKQLKGFHVITAYTDQIGKTQTEIKNYLKNLYTSPAEGVNAPSFGLLVGDVAEIPAWQGNDDHVTDLRYFEYTGDNLPEVFYGRFSASTVEQLQNQIDKTINYEKYLMTDASYLGKSLLVSGVDDDFAPDYGNGAINYIHQYYLNDAHGSQAYTYLYEDAASTVMQSQNSGASASIIAKVNEGVAIANYTAHCSPSGWADPRFVTNDINNLAASGKYGLWIGNCCQSSTFNNSECFAEAALRVKNKGAIGYIGGSNYTYWDEDYYWGVGVSQVTAHPTYENSQRGAYDALFHDLSQQANPETWFITQAQMNVAGNLAVQASSSGLKQYYWEIYHLMGDPSLVPYTSVPETFTATYQPTHLILGNSTLTVNTIPYAVVSLSQNNVLVASAVANDEGTAVLSFTTNALSLGNAQIIITAQNKQPLFDEILVSPANEPYVILNTFETSKSPDYGQTIELHVNFKNLADQNSTHHAQNVIATLSTTNTYVTILSPTASVSLINAGDSVTINNAFQFSIADNIPNGTVLKFNLQITGENAKYTWNSDFRITANAPAIKINTLRIDGDNNNNHILDPAENGNIIVNVENTGNIESVFKAKLKLKNISGTDLVIHTTELSQSIPAKGKFDFVFNATANAATVFGTKVELDFSVTTGNNSQYSLSEDKFINIGEIPVYLMNNSETISSCNGLFYDSGNKTGNYSNSEELIKTFYSPNANSLLKVNFLSFATEKDYDFLYIHDGADVNSPQISGSPFSGTSNPGIITASNALTFRFKSDVSDNAAGWEAEVSCYTPTQAPNCATSPTPAHNASGFFPSSIHWKAENATEFDVYFGKNSNPFANTPTTVKTKFLPITVEPFTTYYWAVVPKNIVGTAASCQIWQFTTGEVEYLMSNGKFYNACSGYFYDSGGKSGNYSSNEYFVMTLYPENENSLLSAKFESFNVEPNNSNCYDVLRIYDGSTVYDKLIGEYCGTSIPEDLKDLKATNSRGALTFAFSSDESENRSGWKTKLTCINTTGFENVEKINLHLFPNPSNGIFEIEFPYQENENYQLKVFDLTGKIVFEQNDSKIEKNIQLNLSNLTQGIYFLNIQSENKLFRQKILIQK